MAADFRNLRWRRSPSLILVNKHFKYGSCVLLQILNIPTKFCEDWSNSKEMATDFRNSRWRQPLSWLLVNMHFNVTIEFYGRFSTFPSNLVVIGSIVKWWQQIVEIQDGGDSHVEKKTLPVEPPVWDRNSWFVSFNPKANFCEVILTF